MTRRPLELRPFRGLRFDPAVVGELGTVVSPPYDMLDAAIVQELEAANRHNVVRLILSRYFEPPYRAVRRRLGRWREHGFLRADDEPALYLYRYEADGVTVTGLIGLLGLRQPSERVVLPHEDVMPGPVADRALLMRTTETNLEPILLVHPATSVLRDCCRTVSSGEARVSFTALDGSRHHLWDIADAPTLAAIARELAPLQALIADGHHRYAAYLDLERELAAGPGSPWSYGLAMLVADDDGTGLRVGPIHRVVAGLTLRDVEEAAAERGDTVREVPGPELGHPPEGGLIHLWLSDGARWVRLSTPAAGAVDAVTLHDALLPAWDVEEAQVSYHHQLDQAMQTASHAPGVVVVVRPPALSDITAAAAAGIRLPRKSTSFAPKPRMGVVMRDLRDE